LKGISLSDRKLSEGGFGFEEFEKGNEGEGLYSTIEKWFWK
jgi:hypothetical protein